MLIFRNFLLARNDDFGILAQEIEKMRSDMQLVVGQVKSGSVELHDIVAEIKDNLEILNSEISDVSATTEELSANSEQAASYSEEILTMSEGIKESSQGIADRAGEGSRQVVEIHQRAENAKHGAIEKRNSIDVVRTEIAQRVRQALNNAEIVKEIDVLVDGKFVLEEKSADIQFRGSRNQRIIDVKKSLKEGKVVKVEKYC